MHPATDSLPLPERPSRRRFGWPGGIFAGWAVSVSVLVAGLAREGCAAMEAERETVVPTGWTLRHELDPRHPDAARVADRLLERRPDRGGRESIVIHGDSEPLHRRLQSAGWKVARTGEMAADSLPRLHVIAPDGTVAWTGYFNPADLASPGSMILDHAVLTEVAHGRTPPPIVPVACARPPEST